MTSKLERATTTVGYMQEIAVNYIHCNSEVTQEIMKWRDHDDCYDPEAFAEHLLGILKSYRDKADELIKKAMS